MNELNVDGSFDRALTEQEREALFLWLCDTLEHDPLDYDDFEDRLGVFNTTFFAVGVYWDDMDCIRDNILKHLPEDVSVELSLVSRFDENPSPDMVFLGPRAEEREIEWCNWQIAMLSARREEAEKRRHEREET